MNLKCDHGFCGYEIEWSTARKPETEDNDAKWAAFNALLARQAKAAGASGKCRRR